MSQEREQQLRERHRELQRRLPGRVLAQDWDRAVRYAEEMLEIETELDAGKRRGQRTSLRSD